MFKRRTRQDRLKWMVVDLRLFIRILRMDLILEGCRLRIIHEKNKNGLNCGGLVVG